VIGVVVLFVNVSAKPPALAVLVARNTSFGGLKNVMRLEVNDAAETVTLLASSERPGTPKGPRSTQIPSLGAEQSAFVAHPLRVAQSTPRTR
jgi:hypothetical protein